MTTLTKEEAKRRFLALVRLYGLQWTADVPASAYAEMAEINKVLTTADRRELFGLRP